MTALYVIAALLLALALGALLMDLHVVWLLLTCGCVVGVYAFCFGRR